MSEDLGFAGGRAEQRGTSVPSEKWEAGKVPPARYLLIAVSSNRAHSTESVCQLTPDRFPLAQKIQLRHSTGLGS